MSLSDLRKAEMQDVCQVVAYKGWDVVGRCERNNHYDATVALFYEENSDAMVKLCDIETCFSLDELKDRIQEEIADCKHSAKDVIRMAEELSFIGSYDDLITEYQKKSQKAQSRKRPSP